MRVLTRHGLCAWRPGTEAVGTGSPRLPHVNATSTRRRPARRPLLAAVALGVTPLVASCSFGTSNFDAQTNQFYTPAEGVNERSGGVDVLNAVIVAEEEGRGRFIAGLVNNSDLEDDALTGVEGSGESADLQGSLETPIDVVADGFVQLADEGEPVVLEGDAIVPGLFVEVTITFDKAAEATIKLPVVPAEDDFEGVEIPAAEASP